MFWGCSRERRGGYIGRGRGGPGGRGGMNNRRREHDRHSGSDKTGIKSVEKRDGSGPHNWGNEIESQLEQPEQDQPKTETSGEAADATTTEGEGDQAPA